MQYGYQLAEMVSRHENDNVAMFDDPLETAQFFVRVEPEKEQEQEEPLNGRSIITDPIKGRFWNRAHIHTFTLPDFLRFIWILRQHGKCSPGKHLRRNLDLSV
jgi:hypothetical protein